MGRRTQSPATGANKRVKLDSPGVNMAHIPLAGPSGTNGKSNAEPTATAPTRPGTDSNAANGDLQLRLAQLEREKAEYEKESLALRVELEKLKAAANNTAFPTRNQLAFNGPGSDLQAKTELFRSRKQNVEPPARKLTGSAGYRRWRELILSRAKEADCHSILDEEQLGHPASLGDADKDLYDEKNHWLYDFLLQSISSSVLSRLDQLEMDGSAYGLWVTLNLMLCHPIEEERHNILKEIVDRTIHYKDDISEMQEWGECLEELGFPLSDWLIKDLVCTRLSAHCRDLVCQEARRQDSLDDSPIFLSLDEISKQLPEKQQQPSPKTAAITPQSGVATEQPPNSLPSKPIHNAPMVENSRGRAPMGRRSRTGNKSRVTCAYCAKHGHTEEECRSKNRSSRTPARGRRGK